MSWLDRLYIGLSAVCMAIVFWASYRLHLLNQRSRATAQQIDFIKSIAPVLDAVEVWHHYMSSTTPDLLMPVERDLIQAWDVYAITVEQAEHEDMEWF